MRLPCAASSAVCVFVDVDERTYGIAPARLEAAIIRVKAEGRYEPKVVVAVDLFVFSNSDMLGTQ